MSFWDGCAEVVISSAVLHFAASHQQFEAMLTGAWRVLAPRGLFFCRLASSIGLETQVVPIGEGRYRLPDGSDRYLVDEERLMTMSARLGGELLRSVENNYRAKPEVHDYVVLGKVDNSAMDGKRELLRHTLATIAYRGGKALRGAPDDSFATFQASPASRTPEQIVAHMGDLFDWALSIAAGSPVVARLHAARVGSRRRSLFACARTARCLSRVIRPPLARSADDSSRGRSPMR